MLTLWLFVDYEDKKKVFGLFYKFAWLQAKSNCKIDFIVIIHFLSMHFAKILSVYILASDTID